MNINGEPCLLIMPALISGGAEKQYRYIISAMNELERNVIVLLLNKPSLGQEKATEEFINSHSNIKFYQLGGNVMNCNTNSKFALAKEKVKTLFLMKKWLAKHLKKNQIHVVMFSYLTQLLMTPFFKRQNIRVIYNERNTGRQVCDKNWKIKLLKKCDSIVSNSDYAAKYIENRIGRTVQIINNGIELSSLTHKPHKNYTITVPGRINGIKNQKVILEALSNLKEKNGVLIQFVGLADDLKYGDELKRYVKEKKLDDHVVFRGYVHNMDSIYEETDLVILPSYEEGTPNVLLEAYMHRILPLVSNIPMNVEHIHFEELLFSPNNASELSMKIKRAIAKELVSNQDRVLNCNEIYVKDKFSMKVLEDSYNKLLFRG